MTTTQPQISAWRASILAGTITALIASAFAILLQMEQPMMYIPAILLVGAGPIIGYALAAGRLAILPLIGGIISSLLFVLSFILWPLFVGILSREHRIGRLYLGSFIGFILGFAVLAVIALSEYGQNPVWLSVGYVALSAIWGGTCGAFMATRRKQPT